MPESSRPSSALRSSNEGVAGSPVGPRIHGKLDETTPSILKTSSAYTNNFDGASTTTLYNIDATTNNLTTQSPPNIGTQNVVGPLNVDATALAGFDIEGGTGTAYAALQPTGDPESSFYRIDLLTGATTLNGQIGPDAMPPLESVSLVPTSVLRFANAVTSVAENGGTAAVTVVREGPLNRTTTVNVATEIAGDDTATAADFSSPTIATLTFVPGDAQETFTVPITDDSADEPNETFTVWLSAPNVASNLQSPPTAQVQIVDDEATPGALTPLVNVPKQSLKQARNRKEIRYGYSCNRACDESTSFRLKSLELGSNASSLAGAGTSREDIELSRSARKALRKAPGRKGVRVKLLSTFTDSDLTRPRSQPGSCSLVSPGSESGTGRPPSLDAAGAVPREVRRLLCCARVPADDRPGDPAPLGPAQRDQRVRRAHVGRARGAGPSGRGRGPVGPAWRRSRSTAPDRHGARTA